MPFVIIHFLRKKKSGTSKYNFKVENLLLLFPILIATVTLHIGIAGPLVDLIPMTDSLKRSLMELVSQKGIFPFLSIVVAAPVLEEFIFRGIVLDGLLKRYSPVKSILLSSILFGFVHLNPWQFLVAFLIGLLIGWVYYHTRSLTLAIYIHMVNNLVGFILMQFVEPMDLLLEESYLDAYGSLTNFIIVVSVSVVLFSISIFYLNKYFQRVREYPEADNKNLY